MTKAKLYFRYSGMGAGKTVHLLQVVNNYERLGKKCIICKPSVDTKGGSKVTSRLGLEKETDFLISETSDLKEDEFLKILATADCMVVDEAQFLYPEQVWRLYEITKEYNIPVIAYGLRTRVNAKPFRGSPALLCLADDIEEIKSICKCGSKASFQIRYINNELDLGDVEIIIDSKENNVQYESVCGDCYVKLYKEYQNNQKTKLKKLY